MHVVESEKVKFVVNLKCMVFSSHQTKTRYLNIIGRKSLGDSLFHACLNLRFKHAKCIAFLCNTICDAIFWDCWEFMMSQLVI